MAYEPTVWADESPVSTPVKYKITDDSKGEVISSAKIEPVTSITPGTPLNAANLNHLEAGVQENWKRSARLIADYGGGLSIAADAITVTPSSGYGFYVIANEAGASSDNLSTISGGLSGDIIALKMTTGQVATLKNAVGNIITPQNFDYALSTTLVTLLRFDGTNWYVISGNKISTDGSVFIATNNSSIQLTPGMIVVFDNAHDSSVKTTVLPGDPSVVGVCLDTIAVGALGRFVINGVRTVVVTGNVTRGHWLIPSSTAGYAKDSGFVQKPSSGGIGIAMTSYSGGGTSTVPAMLNVVPYSSTNALQQLATKTSYVTPAVGSSFSFTHTVDVGTDLLVVRFTSGSGSSTSTSPVLTMTCNGSAMTKVIDSSGNTYDSSGIWIIRNPTAGNVTIAGTLQYTASKYHFYCTNYIGSLATGTIRAYGTCGTGSGNASSISTSSAVGDIAIDTIPTYAADWSPTASGQSVELGPQLIEAGKYGYYSNAPGLAGSTTLSWSGITASRVFGCMAVIAGS